MPATAAAGRGSAGRGACSRKGASGSGRSQRGIIRAFRALPVTCGFNSNFSPCVCPGLWEYLHAGFRRRSLQAPPRLARAFRATQWARTPPARRRVSPQPASRLEITARKPFPGQIIILAAASALLFLRGPALAASSGKRGGKGPAGPGPVAVGKHKPAGPAEAAGPSLSRAASRVLA